MIHWAVGTPDQPAARTMGQTFVPMNPTTNAITITLKPSQPLSLLAQTLIPITTLALVLSGIARTLKVPGPG